MKIYPAVDVYNGQTVRLLQGQFHKATLYDTDPIKTIEFWVSQGAPRLHLVDLNGALNPNEKTSWLSRATDFPISIQIGGGIRSKTDVDQRIKEGFQRIIIGTMAVESPNLFSQILSAYKEKIAVSVDVKNGLLATHGWVNSQSISLKNFSKNLEALGVNTLIYTNVQKDGAMSGPDYKGIQQVRNFFSGTIIVSGGISCDEDLKILEELDVTDVIVGKALYEKKISLDCIRTLDKDWREKNAM